MIGKKCCGNRHLDAICLGVCGFGQFVNQCFVSPTNTLWLKWAARRHAGRKWIFALLDKKNSQIQTVSMMTNYKSLTWNCKESLHVFFGWIWPVCSEDAGWHAHVSITWRWACAHESVNVSIDERAHCCTLRARSCARSRFSQWRTAKDNMSYEISEHNQFDMLLSMGNNKIVKEKCLSSPTLPYNVSPGLQWFQLLPVKIVKKRLQVRKYQHIETSGWKINIFFWNGDYMARYS